MKDEIVIASAMNEEVRIHAARTTNMVEEARRVHDCWPTSAAALGRTMTVTALMASDLKNANEHVMVHLNGGGPAGLIETQADGAGNVRGFVTNPHVYLVRADGHLDVGGAVGTNGNLTVSRDMGLKEPFTGVVPIQTGEIGQDFAYYYAMSEQVPSVVSVGVLVGQNENERNVRAAGGMIIQLMPGASEETTEFVENLVKTMKPMTQYMDSGMEVDALIQSLFPDAQILEHHDIRWHCDCSREHFENALYMLHDKDLKDMIEEDHGAEIVCHFCGKKYYFTEEDLKEILESKKWSKSGLLS